MSALVHDGSREQHVDMTMHALMMAADDFRQLSDDEIRESEADLDLTISILVARLRRLKADTS